MCLMNQVIDLKTIVDLPAAERSALFDAAIVRCRKGFVPRDQFGDHLMGRLCGRILRCGQRHQINDRARRIGSLAANAFSDLVERSPEVLILLFKGCVQLAKIRHLHIPVIAVDLRIQAKRLSQHCVQSLDVDLEYGGHDVCSRNE